MNKQKLIRKFDKQSALYEENTRKRMLKEWRQHLIEGIYGDVLEIAVGTGANFPYYDMTSVRLTAADFSPMMLKRAAGIADELQMQVNFIESDIEKLQLPGQSFDGIVSTLSLCGYDDPVQVLRNIKRWCRPGGQIRLMEHGLGSNILLQSAQHVVNPIARKISGCHWNRDIVQMVKDSSLQIERMERHWGGMIHLIWART
ncbi:class I SAM-dependent methyltransferase [Paenibacillus lutimineralis]|uniref:Class I SAM-dependent methyltransferase n=1 Tax=Paenibacillus lutimineralis TaxID=2707005 RepID=A0A3S9UZQ9_9BACL|nr:class I SAM-dependent methyltransferase [Paenibacillus lutimineralis]AZS15760.1 class I SAM-dependent methyltransferase [Paenibacillus lutimineralis]